MIHRENSSEEGSKYYKAEVQVNTMKVKSPQSNSFTSIKHEDNGQCSNSKYKYHI